MGIKRIVDTSFWTDGKVDEFTPEDKYFMLYLLTNPFSTQLGIYEISIKQVAFQLGYSMDAVRNLLDRFENKYGMILFSKETNEIAIKNFLRHSIVKGGKPVEDCLKREIQKVKCKALIANVFSHIAGRDDLNETVQKIVNEYEIENDNANDNVNDNDNENENEESSPERGTNRQRIVNDSPNLPQPSISTYEVIKGEVLENKGHGAKTCDWCGCKTSVLHKHHHPIPKREGGTETVNICSNFHNEFHVREGQIYGDRHSDTNKRPYGLYKNVFLTDEEFIMLKAEFPTEYLERIDRLSKYMKMKGRTYDDHSATIKTWADEDRKKQIASKPATGNPFLDLLADEMECTR